MITIKLDPLLEQLRKCKLAMVVTHGRSGLSFFVRLFDLHPEIVNIPVIFYFYHHLSSFFNSRKLVGGMEVIQWLRSDISNKLIYCDIDDEIREKYIQMGDDVINVLNRKVFRDCIDNLFSTSMQYDRKEVLIRIHLAFACAIGQDVSKCKYILISEVLSGESDRFVIDSVQKDFNEHHYIIHLERDPRASFCSIRTVYTNSYGSMYPIQKIRMFLNQGSNSIWIWSLLKLLNGYRFVQSIRAIYPPSRFITIRNEDLNSNHYQALSGLCNILGVTNHAPWKDVDYIPTCLGSPWRGFSSMSTTSEKENNGPYKKSMSRNSRAPIGKSLSETWKKQIGANEQIILNYFFRDEIAGNNYSHHEQTRSFSSVVYAIFAPFNGEIPPLEWFYSIRKSRSFKDLLQRLFYLPMLPVNIILSRLVLFSYICRFTFNDYLVEKYRSAKTAEKTAI